MSRRHCGDIANWVHCVDGLPQLHDTSLFEEQLVLAMRAGTPRRAQQASEESHGEDRTGGSAGRGDDLTSQASDIAALGLAAGLSWGRGRVPGRAWAG